MHFSGHLPLRVLFLDTLTSANPSCISCSAHRFRAPLHLDQQHISIILGSMNSPECSCVYKDTSSFQAQSTPRCSGSKSQPGLHLKTPTRTSTSQKKINTHRGAKDLCQACQFGEKQGSLKEITRDRSAWGHSKSLPTENQTTDPTLVPSRNALKCVASKLVFPLKPHKRYIRVVVFEGTRLGVGFKGDPKKTTGPNILRHPHP